MTTNEYLRGVKTSGWAPFQDRLWQRNYYEHVIRDEASLDRTREYILNNRRSGALTARTPQQPLLNLRKYGNCSNGVKKRATGRSPLRRM